MYRSSLGAFALLTIFGSKAHAFTCSDAQKAILNISPASLDTLSVETEDYTDKNAFIQSKPSLDGSNITTRSYLAAGGVYQQLWCKLKSQEAVTGALKTESKGDVRSCASLHERLLIEAKERLNFSQSLSDLGIELLADQEFKTGAQWAPSQVNVSDKGQTISVQATRLHSPTWIPVIGGMNYCKILSPAGAEALLQKAAERFERDADSEGLKTKQVEWNLGGIKGKQSALFYYEGSPEATLSQAKGIYIISPGGEIPAEAMWGLAEGLHKQGFATFTVQYPKQLAIIDSVSGRGNSALNLAERLRKEPSSLTGLGLSSPINYDVRIIGHSLGGATLASEIYKADADRNVSHIVLYGAAQFVKFPGNAELPNRPLAILFGQNDGLSRSSIPGFLKSFDLSFDPADFTAHKSPLQENVVYQQIAELNHFCIISDQSVGNGMLKKKDGQGLAPEQCLSRLLSTLGQLGFL